MRVKLFPVIKNQSLASTVHNIIPHPRPLSPLIHAIPYSISFPSVPYHSISSPFGSKSATSCHNSSCQYTNPPSFLLPTLVIIICANIQAHTLFLRLAPVVIVRVNIQLLPLLLFRLPFLHNAVVGSFLIEHCWVAVLDGSVGCTSLVK